MKSFEEEILSKDRRERRLSSGKFYPGKTGVGADKDYPSGGLGLVGSSDKLLLWIDGRRELAGVIGDHKREVDTRIAVVQKDIDRLSVKTISGNKYYYLWDLRGGKSVCKGKVGGDDYRSRELFRIKKLQAEKVRVEADIRATVVGSVREHLIISTRKFLACSNRTVPLSLLYPYVDVAGRPSTDKDLSAAGLLRPAGCG